LPIFDRLRRILQPRMGPGSLSMNWRSTAVLQLVVLGVTLTANAVVKNSTMRITVLDEETHAAYVNDNGVPKNCDFANFDAYCHNSWTTIVTNVLLVQEGDREPYRVTCRVETKWSHCKPLLKGYSFDAKKEKGGLLIYYLDEVGKLRKQLYTYVAEQQRDDELRTATPGGRSQSEEPAVLGSKQPVAAASIEKEQAAKCSFISSPEGAEIRVDGKFVGSTPSAVNLSTGDHAVVVSMAGFADWKRQLTVSPGSDLTVKAVLQKQ